MPAPAQPKSGMLETEAMAVHVAFFKPNSIASIAAFALLPVPSVNSTVCLGLATLRLGATKFQW